MSGDYDCATTGGTKYDDGKSRLDLIPAEAELEEGFVWGYGAWKYAEHNFRKGIPFSKSIAAAKRHINAISRGEDLDADFDNCQGCKDSQLTGKWQCRMHSGRKHWACVRCCMGMLATTELEHPELDDRYRSGPKPCSHAMEVPTKEGYKCVRCGSVNR